MASDEPCAQPHDPHEGRPQTGDPHEHHRHEGHPQTGDPHEHHRHEGHPQTGDPHEHDPHEHHPHEHDPQRSDGPARWRSAAIRWWPRARVGLALAEIVAEARGNDALAMAARAIALLGSAVLGTGKDS